MMLQTPGLPGLDLDGRTALRAGIGLGRIDAKRWLEMRGMGWLGGLGESNAESHPELVEAAQSKLRARGYNASCTQVVQAVPGGVGFYQRQCVINGAKGFHADPIAKFTEQYQWDGLALDVAAQLGTYNPTAATSGTASQSIVASAQQSREVYSSAQSKSASLSLSDSSFSVGGSWTLQLRTNIPNTSFTMCAVYNGVKSCTPNFGKTDANGNWAMSGTMADGHIGSWQEWVSFPGLGVESGKVSFTVGSSNTGRTSGTDRDTSRTSSGGSSLFNFGPSPGQTNQPGEVPANTQSSTGQKMTDGAEDEDTPAAASTSFFDSTIDLGGTKIPVVLLLAVGAGAMFFMAKSGGGSK